MSAWSAVGLEEEDGAGVEVEAGLITTRRGVEAEEDAGPGIVDGEVEVVLGVVTMVLEAVVG